ncbi:Hpt domain-containing protein [Spirosoma spitsbergense]|uniref:Hpt domain-containing protein n=1 Tax=Spirosoma spitsbergense TaxID=431554 RepID=UPI00037036F6|nr:Hpt domain-containing protein [Spirosoma spitsbergense]
MLTKWLLPRTSDDEAADDSHEQLLRFDPQVIKSMIGDDEELFSVLVEAAEEELTVSLIALQTQAETEDLKALKATGHKLKGTALSAGMQNLAQLAQTLEHLDHVKDDVLKNLVEKIQLEIKQILHLITVVS